MRFLLHNEDAVYDASTKVWEYHLDRRIANPTSLVVKKATFTPVSSLTVHPHVIYMHSRALSEMILDKHTVILRGEAHQNSTDVIGVLEETHTRGRYALTEREGPFRLSPSANKRVIDIYFTDGTGAKMDGEIQAGEASSGGAADDQTMIDLGTDLVLWIDPNYAPLSAQSTLVTENDDSVEYLRNRSPGSAEILLVSNNTSQFVLTSFGETKAVVGGPNSAWAAMADSQGVAVDVTCSMHFMFRAPPSTAAQVILNMPKDMFAIQWWNNTLRFLNESGSWVTITATNFLVNTEWYVEVTHTDNDGDQVGEFSWVFVPLDDLETEYTETTVGSVTSKDENADWLLSAANDNYTVAISCIALLNTGGPTKRETIRTWMLAKFTTEAGVEPPPPPEPATFFAQLNIRTR